MNIELIISSYLDKIYELETTINNNRDKLSLLDEKHNLVKNVLTKLSDEDAIISVIEGLNISVELKEEAIKYIKLYFKLNQTDDSFKNFIKPQIEATFAKINDLTEKIMDAYNIGYNEERDALLNEISVLSNNYEELNKLLAIFDKIKNNEIISEEVVNELLSNETLSVEEKLTIAKEVFKTNASLIQKKIDEDSQELYGGIVEEVAIDTSTVKDDSSLTSDFEVTVEDLESVQDSIKNEDYKLLYIQSVDLYKKILDNKKMMSAYEKMVKDFSFALRTLYTALKNNNENDVQMGFELLVSEYDMVKTHFDSVNKINSYDVSPTENSNVEKYDLVRQFYGTSQEPVKNILFFFQDESEIEESLKRLSLSTPDDMDVAQSMLRAVNQFTKRDALAMGLHKVKSEKSKFNEINENNAIKSIKSGKLRTLVKVKEATNVSEIFERFIGPVEKRPHIIIVFDTVFGDIDGNQKSDRLESVFNMSDEKVNRLRYLVALLDSKNLTEDQRKELEELMIAQFKLLESLIKKYLVKSNSSSGLDEQSEGRKRR